MKDSNDKNVTKTIEHYRPKTKTKSKMPAKINSDIHDIHKNLPDRKNGVFHSACVSLSLVRDL